MTKFGCWIFWVLPESHCHLTNLFLDRQSIRFFFSFLYERCRVLTATKANKTERFIRSSALLDTKSTHSQLTHSTPTHTVQLPYVLHVQPLYAIYSCSYNRGTLHSLSSFAHTLTSMKIMQIIYLVST